MTTEDPRFDENAKTTLEEERESEDASEDFESLFDESDDSQEDAPVTREEFNRLIKGVKKLATDKGREKKEVKEEETTTEVKQPVRDRLAEEVLISKIPELGKSESAMQSIRVIAERTGQDIFTVVDQNEWIVEKAQSEVKRKENKSKLSNPSSDVRQDLDSKLEITAEDRRIADRFFGGDIKRYLKHKQSNQ